MASWQFWTLITAAVVLLIQRGVHARAAREESIEVRALLQDLIKVQTDSAVEINSVKYELQGIRSAIGHYADRMRGE